MEKQRPQIGIGWKLSAYEELDRLGFDFMDVFGTDMMAMSPEDMGPFVPCMRSVQFNEIDFVAGDKPFPEEEHLELYAHWLRTMMELGYRGPFSIETLTTSDFSADAKRTRNIVRKLAEFLA